MNENLPTTTAVEATTSMTTTTRTGTIVESQTSIISSDGSSSWDVVAKDDSHPDDHHDVSQPPTQDDSALADPPTSIMKNNDESKWNDQHIGQGREEEGDGGKVEVGGDVVDLSMSIGTVYIDVAKDSTSLQNSTKDENKINNDDGSSEEMTKRKGMSTPSKAQKWKDRLAKKKEVQAAAVMQQENMMDSAEFVEKNPSLVTDLSTIKTSIDDGDGTLPKDEAKVFEKGENEEELPVQPQTKSKATIPTIALPTGQETVTVDDIEIESNLSPKPVVEEEGSTNLVIVVADVGETVESSPEDVIDEVIVDTDDVIASTGATMTSEEGSGEDVLVSEIPTSVPEEEEEEETLTNPAQDNTYNIRSVSFSNDLLHDTEIVPKPQRLSNRAISTDSNRIPDETFEDEFEDPFAEDHLRHRAVSRDSTTAIPDDIFEDEFDPVQQIDSIPITPTDTVGVILSNEDGLDENVLVSEIPPISVPEKEEKYMNNPTQDTFLNTRSVSFSTDLLQVESSHTDIVPKPQRLSNRAMSTDSNRIPDETFEDEFEDPFTTEEYHLRHRAVSRDSTTVIPDDIFEDEFDPIQNDSIPTTTTTDAVVVVSTTTVQQQHPMTTTLVPPHDSDRMEDNNNTSMSNETSDENEYVQLTEPNKKEADNDEEDVPPDYYSSAIIARTISQTSSILPDEQFDNEYDVDDEEIIVEKPILPLHEDSPQDHDNDDDEKDYPFSSPSSIPLPMVALGVVVMAMVIGIWLSSSSRSRRNSYQL